MFRVYKPKNILRVKAVRVTAENVKDVAGLLMGRVNPLDAPDAPGGVGVPTFDGIKNFAVGQWILRNDDNDLSAMDDADFEKAYEVARNTEAK